MSKRDLPPIHPGEILFEEFLEPMGVSQYRLAKDVNVDPRRINEIVHGTRAISADTALRLGRYFGTSARFWLNLQSHHDLEVHDFRRVQVLSFLAVVPVQERQPARVLGECRGLVGGVEVLPCGGEVGGDAACLRAGGALDRLKHRKLNRLAERVGSRLDRRVRYQLREQPSKVPGIHDLRGVARRAALPELLDSATGLAEKPPRLLNQDRRGEGVPQRAEGHAQVMGAVAEPYR